MLKNITAGLASRLLPFGTRGDAARRWWPEHFAIGNRRRQRLTDAFLRRLFERRAADFHFVQSQLDALRDGPVPPRRVLVAAHERQLHGRRFFLESLFGEGLEFLDTHPAATDLSGIDLVVTLGYGSLSDNMTLLDALRDKPFLLLEAAFLRSILMDKSGSRFDRAMCFFIDDLGHHYDPDHPSRIECLLNRPGYSLGPTETARARALIRRIVDNRLTKYNDQPSFDIPLGRPGRKKVLVIEQARNDRAIVKSGGSQRMFEAMLERAIDDNPDADILVKIHPDTLDGRRGGVKKSYYGDRLSLDNVHKVTMKVNPYSLLDQCASVYVFSSMFGFEALMAGKEVHVFGMPCYAGWGLTTDYQRCSRRRVRRTLEELVHAIYCLYTVYVDANGRRCEPEQAIDYLLALREEFAAGGAAAVSGA